MIVPGYMNDSFWQTFRSNDNDWHAAKEKVRVELLRRGWEQGSAKERQSRKALERNIIFLEWYMRDVGIDSTALDYQEMKATYHALIEERVKLYYLVENERKWNRLLDREAHHPSGLSRDVLIAGAKAVVNEMVRIGHRSRERASMRQSTGHFSLHDFPWLFGKNDGAMKEEDVDEAKLSELITAVCNRFYGWWSLGTKRGWGREKYEPYEKYSDYVLKFLVQRKADLKRPLTVPAVQSRAGLLRPGQRTWPYPNAPRINPELGDFSRRLALKACTMFSKLPVPKEQCYNILEYLKPSDVENLFPQGVRDKQYVRDLTTEYRRRVMEPSVFDQAAH